jgi:hypothetical protein
MTNDFGKIEEGSTLSPGKKGTKKSYKGYIWRLFNLETKSVIGYFEL